MDQEPRITFADIFKLENEGQTALAMLLRDVLRQSGASGYDQASAIGFVLADSMQRNLGKQRTVEFLRMLADAVEAGSE